MRTVVEVELPIGQTTADLDANLLDIHNQRLADMDATGVDFVSRTVCFRILR